MVTAAADICLPVSRRASRIHSTAEVNTGADAIATTVPTATPDQSMPTKNETM